MKQKEDFIAIAAQVNQIRKQDPQRVFTPKELEKVLKGILPTNCAAKAALDNAKIVVRIQRGKYCFPKTPVHWTKIQKFYETTRERQRLYKGSEDFIQGIPLEVIIKEMKAKGYRIFREC